jgi:hypothetical protein
MAHFNEADALIVKIDNIDGGLVENLKGQDGRTGTEVIDSFWHDVLSFCNRFCRCVKYDGYPEELVKTEN